MKTQTVGLVHLDEFKKRRTEIAEQRDREAAEGLRPSVTPRPGSGKTSRESSAGPDKAVKKKRKVGVAKGKLSFGMDDEGDGNEETADGDRSTAKSENNDDGDIAGPDRKRKFNPKLNAPPPKAMTKSTLLREAQEREMLRREFLQLQDKIKSEEITIPFVFYDGKTVESSPFMKREANLSVQEPMSPHPKAKALPSRKGMLYGSFLNEPGVCLGAVSGLEYQSTTCSWFAVK